LPHPLLSQGKPLADSDLVNISTLGKMMTSRPQNKLVSHQASAGLQASQD
jgi:hypothetical protein